MIYVYCNEKTGDKIRLGFTFHQFRGDAFVNDIDLFNSQSAADNYLLGSRQTVLFNNLEAFICAFNGHTKTQVQLDAHNRLNDALRYFTVNQVAPQDACKMLLKLQTQVMELVNMWRGNQREFNDNYMRACMIIQFCHSEISRA